MHKPKIMSDATNAALLNYAGQVTSAGINSMAQTKLNKKTMAYNNEWAYRQREWPLQDWEMQNEYNHPAEQRKRLEEANINPALMYGKGPGDLVSGPIKTTQAPSWNPKAPEVNLSPANALATYYDVRFKDAQLKQMQLQNELIVENIKNKQANTQLTWDKSALTTSQNEKLSMWIQGIKDYNNIPINQTEVENGMYQSLGDKRNYMAENNFWDTVTKFQNYSNSFDENQRREILNSSNVDVLVAKLGQIAIQNSKTQAEITQIQENTDLLRKSGVLKQFNINGQEFLNSRFDAPALKLFLGLLQRADLIR